MRKLKNGNMDRFLKYLILSIDFHISLMITHLPAGHQRQIERC